MTDGQCDGRGPYGVIHRRMWHRADFRALSFEAKAVYAYARTCPAGGLVAIFPLRPEDIYDDLGLGTRRAERALAELEVAGFIQRLRHWVWLVGSFADTPGIRLGNSKHRTAALKALAHVPDELALAFRNLYGLNADARNESGTEADTKLIHGDVAGDGDADERIRTEERTAAEEFEHRLAFLQRQAREITATIAAPSESEPYGGRPRGDDE